MKDQHIYDQDKSIDLFTDGSCTDNGRPFVEVGWGVHVHNSNKLGEYFDALSGQVQTNNRSELTAVESTLHLI